MVLSHSIYNYMEDKMDEMDWTKKLTKKQLVHLLESRGIILASVRLDVAYQNRMRYPCWDCVSIGRRLGMDVKLTAFHKKD